MSTLSQFFSTASSAPEEEKVKSTVCIIDTTQSITLPSETTYVGYGVLGPGGPGHPCEFQAGAGGGFSWRDGAISCGVDFTVCAVIGASPCHACFNSETTATCISGFSIGDICATSGQAYASCSDCDPPTPGSGFGGLINTSGGSSCRLDKFCFRASSGGGGAGGVYKDGGHGDQNGGGMGGSNANRFGGGGGGSFIETNDGAVGRGARCEFFNTDTSILCLLIPAETGFITSYASDERFSLAKTYFAAAGGGGGASSCNCFNIGASGGGGGYQGRGGFGGGSGRESLDKPSPGGGSSNESDEGGDGFAMIEFWKD